MTSAGRLSEEVFEELLLRGSEIWRDFTASRGGRFTLVIPADQRDARAALEEQSACASSFLELGSGAGVITILADLLGFDAYGIEIEPGLVEASQDLAEHLGSGATFVEGSFVPVEFRDEVELLSGDFVTVSEGADAYDELGLTLRDFDLVYGYPWPGEEDWMVELVRREAGPDTSLMMYSVADGFQVTPARAQQKARPGSKGADPFVRGMGKLS